MFAFKNRYGTAMLLPVSEPQHISTVYHSDIAARNKISLADAEKLALITGNRNVQIIANWFGTSAVTCGVVYHLTSDSVVICRVAHMEYKGSNPADELHSSRLS